jgi:hypothetical protein
MTKIRLDKVVISGYHESYQNYSSPSPEDIVVNTAPIPNGSGRTQTVTIPYTRAGTRADIFATNLSNGRKTILSMGGRAAGAVAYTAVSSEVARFDVTYQSSTITVSLNITNNSGSSINPPAQTIRISVVQYAAPITPIV